MSGTSWCPNSRPSFEHVTAMTVAIITKWNRNFELCPLYRDLASFYTSCMLPWVAWCLLALEKHFVWSMPWCVYINKLRGSPTVDRGEMRPGAPLRCLLLWFAAHHFQQTPHHCNWLHWNTRTASGPHFLPTTWLSKRVWTDNLVASQIANSSAAQI